MRDPTFACIVNQATTNDKIVEEFLSNPKWLLCWFEKAPALEIYLTINEYFIPHKSYY